jgi:membrane protein YqaA with SNARE-associated domain
MVGFPLSFLEHILARYTAFLWAVLKPLGVLGVFGFAAFDAAFIAMPLDPVVAGYVYADRPRFLLYALMASVGSALGSLVVYGIGYKGGEILLLRRISRERFEGIRRRFESREFWALMVPSMLPPPAPFKLFVLSAGVFEMSPLHFLLAIFAGRMVRFLVLSLLTLTFGPQIVSVVGALLRSHFGLTVLVVAASIGIIYLIYRLWREPVAEVEKELELTADDTGDTGE